MPVRLGLAAFDLPVFELNRRRATEDRDRNAQLTALRIDFFHDTILVLERSVRDLDRLADFKADFRLHLFLALLHLREQAVHFRLAHRDWLIFGAGEADYTRRFTNEIPGAPNELVVLVEQMHVHDQVSREKIAGGL